MEIFYKTIIEYNYVMLINYPLFNRKKDGSGVNAHSVEIAAFQAKNSSSSRGGGHDRIDVPIEIVPMTKPGSPYQELENCFVFNFVFLYLLLTDLGACNRAKMCDIPRLFLEEEKIALKAAQASSGGSLTAAKNDLGM